MLSENSFVVASPRACGSEGVKSPRCPRHRFRPSAAARVFRFCVPTAALQATPRAYPGCVEEKGTRAWCNSLTAGLA